MQVKQSKLRILLNKKLDGLFSPFFDDLFKFQILFPVFGDILTDSLNWIKNWISNKLKVIIFVNISTFS